MQPYSWKQFEADRDRMLGSAKIYAKPEERKQFKSLYEKVCRDRNIAPSWTVEGQNRLESLRIDNQREFVQCINSMPKTQRERLLSVNSEVSEAMYQDWLRGDL